MSLASLGGQSKGIIIFREFARVGLCIKDAQSMLAWIWTLDHEEAMLLVKELDDTEGAFFTLAVNNIRLLHGGWVHTGGLDFGRR